MLFTLAALGLPGTSGFVGEFLILMAAFKDNFLVATIACFGVIIGAAYMLWLYKRVVFGKLINEDLKKILDLNRSEYFILSCLAAPMITPKLDITATKKFSLNAPIKIKNSPTKPLVPGKPKAAKVNIINKTEYLGTILTIPPYVLINLECILS